MIIFHYTCQLEHCVLFYFSSSGELDSSSINQTIIWFNLICFVQTRDLNITKTEEDIGFYAGFIGEEH